ncbi:MAG: lytic transglycosylase domain-containing protein [Deltaproteobacteria bacterium]|nr:lytic transglycosylase domain-containing protein [Deltaproteobacteria bacterium]
MSRLNHHMSRLTLVAILAGLSGLAGIMFFEPAPRVTVQASASCQAVDPAAAARQRLTVVLPLRQRQRVVWPLARKAARKHGLEPALVMAVIQTESRFLPQARSHRGAMGLMQITPTTARHLKLTSPLDPQANLDAGVGYLAHLYREHQGDLRLALAAYNAGPAKVAQAGGIPDIPETRQYVDQVLTNLDHFRAEYSAVARF